MSDNDKAAERHREVLALEVAFSKSDLKTAYIDLIQRWHPDRFATQPREQAAATEKAKAINVAYEFLAEALERTEGNASPNGRNRHTYADNTRPSAHPPYPGAADRQSNRTGFTNRTVTEIFLKSSHIVSTAYNRATQILYIKFGDNSVYRYFQVPETVFEAFLKASSPGKFAHRHIYKQYRNEPCARLPGKTR